MDIEIKEDILSIEDESLEKRYKPLKIRKVVDSRRRQLELPNHRVRSVWLKRRMMLNESGKCSHCGRRGHGSSRQERENTCSAFNKSCNKCGKQGLFCSVCRSHKQKEKGSSNEIKDGNLSHSNQDGNHSNINQVSAVVHSAGMMSIKAAVKKGGSLPPVPHMLYEQLELMKKPPPGHVEQKLHGERFCTTTCHKEKKY